MSFRSRVHQNRKREETPQRLYTNRPRKWIYHLQLPFNPQMPGEMQCFFTAPADLFFSEGNKANYNIDNFFFCSEDDDIFNDYGEEMDLRPLTQEELRSAIINKVTRKSTCQRLYIRHARSTKLQWGPKNLMFYSTINLQLVELQNFRKLFCSV